MGDSHLVGAIQKLASGEIVKVPSLLLPPPQQVSITFVTEVVPHKLSSSSLNIQSSFPSPAQLLLSPSPAQLPLSQVPDVCVPLVIWQMILKHGVDEVQFLLTVGDKMLTTDTSGDIPERFKKIFINL